MSSLSEEVRTEVLCGYICDPEAENAKLRDEIKRRDELESKLIKCIENDYGILFAWDPLRKVWISECTDEYVTERERMETENAKLRKELADAPKCETCEAMLDCDECLRADGSHKERRRLDAENNKLRELLEDALKTLFYKRFDGSVGCTENCPRWQFSKDCQLVDGCWLELEAAKLGIEAE